MTACLVRVSYILFEHGVSELPEILDRRPESIQNVLAAELSGVHFVVFRMLLYSIWSRNYRLEMFFPMISEIFRFQTQNIQHVRKDSRFEMDRTPPWSRRSDLSLADFESSVRGRTESLGFPCTINR